MQKLPFGKPLTGSVEKPDTKSLDLLYRSSAVDALHINEDDWAPESFVFTRTNRFQGFKQSKTEFMDEQDRLDYDKSVLLIPITYLPRSKALSSLFDKNLLYLAEQLPPKQWSLISLISQAGKSELIPKLQQVNDKKGSGYGSKKKLSVSLQKTKKKRLDFKLSVPVNYDDDDEESGPSLVIRKVPAKSKKPVKKIVEKLAYGSFIQNNTRIDDYKPKFNKVVVKTEEKYDNVEIKTEEKEENIEIKTEINTEAQQFLSQLESSISYPEIPKISLFHTQRALNSLSSDQTPEQQRYRGFLQFNAGIINNYYSLQCVREAMMTFNDIEHELQSFAARATELTNVLPRSIAFTSNIKKEEEDNEHAESKTELNVETQTVQDWTPAPLLCKRFGIRIKSSNHSHSKHENHQNTNPDPKARREPQYHAKSSLAVPKSDPDSIDLYNNPSLYRHSIPDFLYEAIFS